VKNKPKPQPKPEPDGGEREPAREALQQSMNRRW
jgi:hypothetical protein